MSRMKGRRKRKLKYNPFHNVSEIVIVYEWAGMKYPWRIKDVKTGDYIRKEPVGRVHEAFKFMTREQAERFIKKQGFLSV